MSKLHWWDNLQHEAWPLNNQVWEGTASLVWFNCVTGNADADTCKKPRVHIQNNSSKNV